MNRLRELRVSKGLTLKELGKEVGMHPSVLGNYERDVRSPKLEVWEKLANFFNVSSSYIMGLSDNKKEVDEDTLKNLILKANSSDSFTVKNTLDYWNEKKIEFISLSWEKLELSENIIIDSLISIDADEPILTVLRSIVFIDNISIDASEEKPRITLAILADNVSEDYLASYVFNLHNESDFDFNTYRMNNDSIIKLLSAKNVKDNFDGISLQIANKLFEILQYSRKELFNDSFNYSITINFFNQITSKINLHL